MQCMHTPWKWSEGTTAQRIVASQRTATTIKVASRQRISMISPLWKYIGAKPHSHCVLTSPFSWFPVILVNQPSPPQTLLFHFTSGLPSNSDCCFYCYCRIHHSQMYPVLKLPVFHIFSLETLTTGDSCWNTDIPSVSIGLLLSLCLFWLKKWCVVGIPTPWSSHTLCSRPLNLTWVYVSVMMSCWKLLRQTN